MINYKNWFNYELYFLILLGMEDLEELISKYNTESSKALEILNRDRSIKISSAEFQLALGNLLGYSAHPADNLNVITHELNCDDMLDILSKHTFEQRELICEIKIPEAFIPKSFPRLLEEKQLKFKGHILQVYKTDVDPWPSKPHAHSKEFGWKVHLGNGKCFDNNKNHVYTFRKKDLIYIREKLVVHGAPPFLEV